MERAHKEVTRQLAANSRQSERDTKAAYKGIADGAKMAATAIAGIATAAAGAGFGMAISKGMEFGRVMASVSAVSNASAADMKRLSELALTAGRDFGFSGAEAGRGLEELVKAGVSMQDVLGGAGKAALTLAAAGTVSVAEAAEVASAAMNQFSLKGGDMAHVANVVAGAANASAINVNDFRLSLTQSGTVAALTGQNFDSLATAIAVMGAQGLKGSDAGTSLKTMLLNLQPTTKEAAEMMKLLGITAADGSNAFFDATGKAKGMREIADVLAQSLSGLTEKQKTAALEIMFGTDALRAAGVLAKAGAAGFDAMSASMSKISAEKAAQDKLNSLGGDMDKLTSKLESVGVAATTKAEPALRDAVRRVTELVDVAGPTAVTAFSNFAEGLNGVAAAAQIVTRHGGDAAAAMMGMIPGLAALRDAWNLTTAIGQNMPKLGRGGLLPDAVPGRGAFIQRGIEGNFHDLAADEMWAAREAAEAFAKSQAQVKTETDKVDPAIAKLRAEFEALMAKMRGGAGAAKEAKSAFQELGIGMDDLRRAGELGLLTQQQVDAAILRLGGTIMDTGPLVEGFGVTTLRLAAAFNAAGLDGDALVQKIMEINAATKAKAEADKAAAEAERAAAKAQQEAEEAARKAAEEAKKARDAVVAGISGTAARDMLGAARGRAPKDASQAAADFAAAARGFDAITKAGMDASVALDVMEQRLAALSGQFAGLSGDDLASAGAATDAVRKLLAEFRAGRIGAEELAAGLNEISGDFGRLAGVVDAADAALKEWVRTQHQAARAEMSDRIRETITIWQDALKNDTLASQVYWQKQQEAMAKTAATAQQVADAQIQAMNRVHQAREAALQEELRTLARAALRGDRAALERAIGKFGQTSVFEAINAQVADARRFNESRASALAALPFGLRRIAGSAVPLNSEFGASLAFGAQDQGSVIISLLQQLVGVTANGLTLDGQRVSMAVGSNIMNGGSGLGQFGAGTFFD